MSLPLGTVSSTSTRSTRAPGGPCRMCALEPFDRFRLAFRRRFDAAVGQVPHPAVQAFARRRRLGEVPEADALNAAADEISSRDAHRETRYENRAV